MKTIAAIIGICLFGCIAQAQQAPGTSSPPPSSTQHKSMNPQAILAEINSHIAKRQAEEQEAVGKGRTDIANALQKIVADLNNMKTALTNKNMSSFKSACEQRKQDVEALEALRKSEKPSGKQATNSSKQGTDSSGADQKQQSGEDSLDSLFAPNPQQGK
jgi:Skp family chaperone for outer membrane proteins